MVDTVVWSVELDNIERDGRATGGNGNAVVEKNAEDPMDGKNIERDDTQCDRRKAANEDIDSEATAKVPWTSVKKKRRRTSDRDGYGGGSSSEGSSKRKGHGQYIEVDKRLRLRVESPGQEKLRVHRGRRPGGYGTAVK